jgi:hypothetical protein
MILGTHELVGSMETLKQPFCVLQKTTESKDKTDDLQSSTHGVSYHVQGVVTRKLLFNKYPKAILRSAVSAAAKQ